MDRDRIGTVLSPSHLVIFGIALIARLGYWLYAGTRVRGDAVSALDAVRCFVSPAMPWLSTREVLYSGFHIPFCVTVRGLGLGVDTWIAVQVLLSVLGCVLLFDAAGRTTGPIGAWTAGLCSTEQSRENCRCRPASRSLPSRMD